MHLRLIPEEHIGLVLIDGTCLTLIVGIESTKHKGVSLLRHGELLRVLLHLEGEMTIVVGDDEVTTLIYHILSIHLERSTIHRHGGLLIIDITLHIKSIIADEVLVVEICLILVQIDRILFRREFWIEGCVRSHDVWAVTVFHLREEVSTRDGGLHRLQQHFLSILLLQQLHLYVSQSRTVLESEETCNLTCSRATSCHIIRHDGAHAILTLIRDFETIGHRHTSLHFIIIIIKQLRVNVQVLPLVIGTLPQQLQFLYTLHIQAPLQVDVVMIRIVRSRETPHLRVVSHRLYPCISTHKRLLLPFHHTRTVIGIDDQRVGILGARRETLIHIFRQPAGIFVSKVICDINLRLIAYLHASLVIIGSTDQFEFPSFWQETLNTIILRTNGEPQELHLPIPHIHTTGFETSSRNGVTFFRHLADDGVTIQLSYCGTRKTVAHTVVLVIAVTPKGIVYIFIVTLSLFQHHLLQHSPHISRVCLAGVVQLALHQNHISR